MKELFRAKIEKMVLLGMGTLAVAGALGVQSALFAATAHAESPAGTNPYPYAKSSYWAWQNRPDLPANLGLPKDWAKNAAAQGWPVSEYPRRGDVAVFQPGVYGADKDEGHVAFVEQVFSDGTYSAGQMDENDCRTGEATCGRINRRTFQIIQGTLFIHYKLDSRTTWGFASGASGWTAGGMGAGNMGGPGWFYPLTGDMPQLTSPELSIPLDSYNAIEVEMVLGVNVTDPSLQVLFATDTQRDFVPANTVQTKGVADGALRKYTFYFGGNSDWQGTLARLRFNPAGAGATGGLRIDRIRLVHTDSTVSYSTLSTTGGGGRSRP